MAGELQVSGRLSAGKQYARGMQAKHKGLMHIIIMVILGLMLGTCLGQMEAVKENVKPAKSLQKLSFEKIMRGVSSRGRFLVYFSKTEV